MHVVAGQRPVGRRNRPIPSVRAMPDDRPGASRPGPAPARAPAAPPHRRCV